MSPRWLRPALQSSYQKMAGRSIHNAPIFINRQVTTDLLWFADSLGSWDGIHMLSARAWDSSHADFIIYCDAALTGGLAFWSPHHWRAFVADKPEAASGAEHIFLVRSSCGCQRASVGFTAYASAHRLAIFTDSLNTVQLFDSMACLPAFHDLLLFACRLCLTHHIDLRVFHIFRQSQCRR